jgi:lipopolysaccharide transport system permease protein
MITDELQTVAPPAARTHSARRRRVRTVQPRQPNFGYALAEIWRYRRFTTFFGRRFVRKSYQNTWIGFPWLFLRPYLDIGTKLFVFGGLIGITAGDVPYPLFVMTATAAWMVFAEAFQGAARSLYMARNLLQVVHLPRTVVILGSIVPTAVHFLLVLFVAALLAGYYLLHDGSTHLDFSPESPVYIVAALSLLLLQGVGLGIVGAVVGARTRDLRFMLGYILAVLYFLTPILYSFQKVPEKYRLVTELSPMTGGMEMFKAGVFGTPFPPMTAVVASVVTTLLIWGPGFWLFHRLEVRDW